MWKRESPVFEIKVRISLKKNSGNIYTSVCLCFVCVVGVESAERFQHGPPVEQKRGGPQQCRSAFFSSRGPMTSTLMFTKSVASPAGSPTLVVLIIFINCYGFLAPNVEKLDNQFSLLCFPLSPPSVPCSLCPFECFLPSALFFLRRWRRASPCILLVIYRLLS